MHGLSTARWLQRQIGTLVVFSAALAGTMQAQGGPQPLALTHVNVVDVASGADHANVTVVVAHGRIIAMGPSETTPPPSGARVVDATGKFLIPGLWDMHVHLGQWPVSALRLLVAHGVTGVRDMGTALGEIQVLRDAVAAGRTVGPRVVAAGAILDGPGHASPERRIVASVAEATFVVDSLAAAGADSIKVYEFLPRDAFLAIVAEAKAKHLDVVGHVPRAAGVIRAIDAGQRSVEHLSGVPLPCPLSMRWAARTPGLGGVMPPCGDDGARRDVFAHFRAANAWVTPTLVAYRGAARATDPSALGTAAEPRMRLVNATVRRHWDEQIAKWPKLVPASYRRSLPELYGRVTRDAHLAHVAFLAGSDLGNTLVFPGSGLHDELELLVGAGLSALEALQAATVGPARFLGVADSLGRVEPGMVADLVLLDADPRADIRNVRRIAAVVRGGVLLDRRALDRLVADETPP